MTITDSTLVLPVPVEVATPAARSVRLLWIIAGAVALLVIITAVGLVHLVTSFDTNSYVSVVSTATTHAAGGGS
jgi:hypothetical protein